LCFDEFSGDRCDSVNIKKFIRIEDMFKNRENQLSDDRFLFISILMCLNTVIMLLGIFISYQKTKRWNYRNDESFTL